MAVLEARNLAKSYGKRPVVKDVSLSVKQGEIVGLLGPNGAGKTTCFYMIIGLVSQDGGVVTVDAQDITALPMHGRARRGLGYLPQEPSIFRKLSVEDNILAILETRSELSRQQRRQRLEDLLHEFHISHLAKNTGMSLSGGERRRVEIARALAADPQFILLDEPFTGVDVKTETAIIKLLGEMRKEGKIMLVSTHNLGSVPEFCDRTILIKETILAYGKTENTFTRQNLELAFGGVLRHFVLSGTDLHDDDDRREVRVISDDERPFVLYDSDKKSDEDA